MYMNSDKKNISKLSEYSEKMVVKKQVIEMVGMFRGRTIQSVKYKLKLIAKDKNIDFNIFMISLI